MKDYDISQNYITICGWMVEDLELDGKELLAFGLVYGFSQNKESEFCGSLAYLAKWLRCSKPTAHRIINNLVEKSLLTKTNKQVADNICISSYKVNFAAVEMKRRSKYGMPFQNEQNAVPNMEYPVPNMERYNIDNNGSDIESGENEFSHTPTPAPDKNFNSVSELDAAQPYQWVEEKKENSAKERKTLFENSELYKSLAVFDGDAMNADATLANLEKKFTNVPDNVDLLYYFGAVARWSNSSNTKRTSRGWKSTIENFVCGDVEKKKLHTKINQDKDKSDIDLMNLFNKF